MDGTVEEVVAGLKPYLKRKVKYTIRPVKEEDLKKVAEVEALCFPAAEAAGYEDFMERYKTCKKQLFVAETETAKSQASAMAAVRIPIIWRMHSTMTPRCTTRTVIIR